MTTGRMFRCLLLRGVHAGIKIVGIDPGSHRTGYGIVCVSGGRLQHVASGTIDAEGESLSERLCQIATALEHVLLQHNPQSVAIESIFHAKNARSALLLGHARGVSMLIAARRGLAVFEYTAGQIKQAVTGRGRASKEQVQEMVRHILAQPQPMGMDTSDALAAAICHGQSCATPTAVALRQATQKSKGVVWQGKELRASVHSFRPRAVGPEPPPMKKRTQS